jgi:hypothetical protein
MSTRKMVISFSIFVFLFVSNTTLGDSTDWDNPPFFNCSDETGLDGKWGGDHASLMRNMATVDFDGDGILDLLISKVSNPNPNNNRGDAFEGTGPNSQGSPTFVQSEAFSLTGKPKNGTAGFIFADFDNDGDTDFYAPNPNGHQLYEYNSTTHEFEDKTTFRGLESTTGSVNATWGDYDGDGRVDLLILCGTDDGPSEHSSSSQKLYHNELIANETFFVLVNSASNFQSAANVSTAQMVDFDGDYDLDILLAQNEIANASVYSSTYQENDGAGHFSLKSVGIGSSLKAAMCRHDNYASVTDVNNDGRLDLIFGNNWRVGYCLGDNEGNFSNSGFWTKLLTETNNPNVWDLTATDWNLDGFNDFLLSCRDNSYRAKVYSNRLYQYLHGHSDSFTKSMRFTEMSGQRGMCVGDFSKDHITGDFSMTGFPEICFADDQIGDYATSYFWRRQSLGTEYPKNNWIGFELSAPGGTADSRCIGAKVTVSAASLGHDSSPSSHIQSQVVDGGSGRASQRALDLVFGLGGGSTPVDAKISLPIGRTVFFHQIPANAYASVAVDGVIDSTVQVTKWHDVVSETMTFTFTWNTIGVDTFDQDKIVFYTDETNACLPASETVYVGTSVLAEVSSSEKIWSHQLEIEGIPCSANCAYYFSVQSQSGDLYMGSSEHSFNVKLCPKTLPGI